MDIRVENLSKTYAGRCVLNIDSFTVKRHTLLGVIGPNGAGKSTLIRIMAGIDRPSSGKILYNDQLLDESISKNITMVFQKPYLLRTSVFNNIAYPLMIRKVDKKEIAYRVNKIMEEMEIGDLGRQNAWTLSGGEAQKVALARALVFNPSLLLLDEPTANIDPASILIMEKMIRKFYKENLATVIIVTHNIQQSKRLCNDIIFMNEGKVEEYGSTEQVIGHATKTITQRFLEESII